MTTEIIDGVGYEVIEDQVFTAPRVESGSFKIYRRNLFAGGADGRALLLNGASHIIVETNTFTGWQKAIACVNSRAIKLRYNDLHGMTVDGMSIVNRSEDIEAEANWVHDFNASEADGSHRDCIQLWAIDGQPTPVDVLLVRNLCDSGSGVHTQSIFANSKIGLAFPGLRVIENIVYNGHKHGIAIAWGMSPFVARNRLAGNPIALQGSLPGVMPPRLFLPNTVDPTLIDNIEDDARLHDEIAGIRAMYAAACGANGSGVLGALPAPAPEPNPGPAPVPEPTPAPEPIPEPEPAPDPDAVELAQARRYRAALSELRDAEAEWLAGGA